MSLLVRSKKAPHTTPAAEKKEQQGQDQQNRRRWTRIRSERGRKLELQCSSELELQLNMLLFVRSLEKR
ncbi:hypothetical protein RRG08_006389 [Elysia crispata]|uniref:Uncharacterized protein n=1 Tax=Elysia crispata TaxID=231223 RepID=A0AAE0Y2T1_9GAST|nr:hypothetical protein RRG08_004711 [Elysia crispata]KAK3730539.1 hypothetical protein RRG08_006389 [Elysia crispata]